MKHFLSIEKLTGTEIERLLALAARMKKQRGRKTRLPLEGQSWAMLFAKASTRTRVSFEVGIRELGGQVIFLPASEIQLGRGEPIKDTARVLGRMVHGAVFRTFAQRDVEEFAQYAGIPTINALTDEEHPCQIVADIFTFGEKRGSIAGKVVTFIGDGACNVANSWVFAAAKLNFELRIASPARFRPAAELLRRAGGKVTCTANVKEAATGADLLYTDVWVSMGKESESAERTEQMRGYQINKVLTKLAKKDALVMHCLPAYRGKEIDAETFEAHAATIFDQAENRLHSQKAVLTWLLERPDGAPGRKS
jgi:ornithine carbamoyltransferase